jgi:hypothetical protein
VPCWKLYIFNLTIDCKPAHIAGLDKLLQLKGQSSKTGNQLMRNILRCEKLWDPARRKKLFAAFSKFASLDSNAGCSSRVAR